MQVAVIGGTRGLGNWIANFLKKKGYNVTITGRTTLIGMETAEKMGVTFTSNNTEAAIPGRNSDISCSYRCHSSNHKRGSTIPQRGFFTLGCNLSQGRTSSDHAGICT